VSLLLLEKNSNSGLEHRFSKSYLFRVFRMKYFKDIDIISKFYPISNSNVSTFITNMNNTELSSDSGSSNEVYNINYNNKRNNIVNNSSFSDSENNNIVTINVVNSSIGENRVNLSNFLNNEAVNVYVMWYRLYNFFHDGRDTDIMDLNFF